MLGTLDAVSVSGYRADCALWRIPRRGDDVGRATLNTRARDRYRARFIVRSFFKSPASQKFCPGL